jgi:hypothetical protein
MPKSTASDGRRSIVSWDGHMIRRVSLPGYEPSSLINLAGQRKVTLSYQKGGRPEVGRSRLLRLGEVPHVP